MTTIYRSLGAFMASTIAMLVLLVLLLGPALLAPRAVAALTPFVRSQSRAGPVTKAADRDYRQRLH